MSRRRPRNRALPENDAALAGLLFALDPHASGGVRLRGLHGADRRHWLDKVRSLGPADSPFRKVPVNVSEERLLGGLDFATTIAAGKPVFTSGLLENTDGGVLVVSMAERISDSAAAIIGAGLDAGEVRIERDGIARIRRSRFGVIALDEGLDDDEQVSAALDERLSFTVDLARLAPGELQFGGWTADDIAAARRRFESVRSRPERLETLCRVAAAFGIASLRAEIFALRAARGITALRGGRVISESDAAIAARLVFPQRARVLPLPPEAEADPPPPETDRDDSTAEGEGSNEQSLADDVLVEAIAASLPPDVLAMLTRQSGARRRRSSAGRSDTRSKSRRRGRPIGTRPTDAIAGQRLNILATLKAAAPWQGVRRQASTRHRRLELRKEDLHVTRFKERVEMTIVFVVDASGSQAAQRLAEVKGAIEILLNDCYVRRDQVALIAFRGSDAEMLMPPTRSLARARRLLAALPGGGGTPLAAGIDAARELAESIVRQGRIPAIVLLTDGRANVSRDREPGAERAGEEALAAARLLADCGADTLLIDTSRRPRPRASELADAMHARYLPLPRADAETLSATVQRGVAA